jgi:chlorophyll synthase
MTLNDFKSVEGDLKMGIRSLPAMLGIERAVRLACVVMVAPQVMVVALLTTWERPVHAAIIVLLIVLQLAAMLRLLRRPRELAPWYNGTGVLFSVLGMMVSAFAVATLPAG